MLIDFDVPIEADDGVVLRADVYRPVAGRCPVIMSNGPYAKGMSFPESRPYAWKHLVDAHPEVTQGSTCRYQAWEVVDPEKWVPDGYAVVRVDSRGSGRSAGYLDPWSPRETRDLYECIEWAARQPWSSGKVGLNGISYYAMNAWQVAALNPPHLTAICAWEGAADHYRDVCYHGGIFCEFLTNWYARGVIPMQHGHGDRGPRSRLTGELVTGPETLADETLARNRNDIVAGALAHPRADDYHRVRSAELERITVPFLSAGNWGGHALHLRGNTEAFMRAASPEKWLEFHGGTHWTHFYTDYGLDLQKRFFGHFLKGERTGWDTQPPVQLQIRHPGEAFELRHEKEWPLARTQWTKFYLDAASGALQAEPCAAVRARLRQHRRRGHLLHATFDGAAGNYRPSLRPTKHRVGYDRRRRVRDLARIRAGWPGGRLPRRARSAHPDRFRMATGIQAQARRRPQPAISSLSRARRGSASRPWRAGIARHRALANVNRDPARPSPRADGARKRLRVSRRSRKGAGSTVSAFRGRPIPARGSAQSSAAGIRGPQRDPFRRGNVKLDHGARYSCLNARWRHDRISDRATLAAIAALIPAAA